MTPNIASDGLDEILDRVLWVPGLGQEELYRSMRKALKQAIQAYIAEIGSNFLENVGEDDKIEAWKNYLKNGNQL